MEKRTLRLRVAAKVTLLVLLLGLIGMTKGYSVEIGNLKYSLNSSTLEATVTGHKNGTSATGSLIIPETVSYEGLNYIVTEIGLSAFLDCSGLTGSLSIPNSVTTIGANAFSGCSGLTGTLVIPNTVTSLGSSAFLGCSGFTGELVIPNSLSIIRGAVFSGCTGLSGSLSFPSSVNSIKSRAFENCSGFNGVLTIENTVTEIGYSAFKGCSGFTAVHYNVIDCFYDGYFSYFYEHPPFQNCSGALEIGEDVERIPEYMFYKAGFTGNLVIPSSVTELGSYVFSKCSGFTGDLIIPGTISSIGRGVFSGCSGFNGQLVIPNTWTTIAASTFSGCSGLCGNLIIPNSIASIGDDAFAGCRSFIGTLSIPNSVVTIEYSAFLGCSGFSGISIPNTISVINENTFSGCSGITSLVIPNSVTRIGNEAFWGCSDLTTITIPSSISSIGWWAFDNTGWYNNQPDGVLYLDSWCLGYKGTEMNPIIDIQEGTMHVADGAFMNNRELSSITLPNSLVTVGSHAFEMCEHLASVTFGNSLTSIGNNAFSLCSALNALELPNSLLRIEDGAFWQSGLHSIVIPDAVTYIGENAFELCYMRSLTLGSSVTTIGNNAFGQCEGLRSIISLSLDSPTVGEETFNMVGQYNTVIVYVPESAISDYQSAPVWSGFENVLPIAQNDGFDFTYSQTEGNAKVIGYHGESESLSIPSSIIYNGNTYPVTSIGDWAFSDNQHIKSVSFPDAITTIGEAAFYNCNNLSGDLMIPNTVESIGRWAFIYCSQIKSVLIGNSVSSIGASAFSGCNGITGSVILGSSITSIGMYAFSGCSKIKEIWSLNVTPPSCGSYSFLSVNINTPLYVPCGSQSNYESANCWSTFTNYHEIPSCLIVKTSSEVLGEASVVQFGNCENNESIIHAEPYFGAVFTGWKVNGEQVSTEMDYTFPLTDDMVLTAHFEPASNHFVFVGANNQWNDPSNWEPNGLPTETSTVGVWGNVEIDGNVCVNSLVIYGDYTITILPNSSLTVLDTLVTPNTSSLVVKEGGELMHSCNGVLATVEKTVSPYSKGEQDGWNLVTLPMAENHEISSIANLTTEEYDLYYYDEPTNSWMNQKDTDADFHQLKPIEGYIYASKGEMLMCYGFEEGLEGWTAISLEGNNTSWHYVSNTFGSHTGKGYISSSIAYHYVNGNYYSDDDYIVSPLVHFTSSSTVSFWVYNSDWVFEHFGVAVSTSGNTDASDFTTIQEWTPNAKTSREEESLKGGRAAGGWCQYTVDLSQYAGQSGYIAIRHYECTDMQHVLRVDDIELGGMSNLRNAVTISFSGELKNGSAPVSVPLSCTEGVDLVGWNLIGNPFPCNAYINREYYVLNEDGTAINPVAMPASTPIPPCTAVMVKAEAEGETAIFTRAVGDRN